MSALPKGWAPTSEGLRHVCGVYVSECYEEDDDVFVTHPETGEHPTLDAAIAALEPHIEAWREAVREAVGQTASAPVAAVPVAAERDLLVDPRPGDGIEATMPSGAKRWIDVASVGGRIWFVEVYNDDTRILGSQSIGMWAR